MKLAEDNMQKTYEIGKRKHTENIRIAEKNIQKRYEITNKTYACLT